MKRRSFLLSMSAVIVAASMEVFGWAEKTLPQAEIKKYDEVKFSSVRHCQVRIDEFGNRLYRVAPADHNFVSVEFPEFRTEDEALEWAGVKFRWNAADNDRTAPELPMPIFPEAPDLATLLREAQQINGHCLAKEA